MNSAAAMTTLLFTFAVVLLGSSASAQTCSSYSFSNNAAYKSCLDLPYLSSFLHWNYNQSTYVAEIAFRMTGVSSTTWVTWAINPTGGGMLGCEALVAYLDSNGQVNAYTSVIDSYSTTMPQGPLSFGVPTISGTFQNGEMTIFAKLQLSANLVSVRHLWQEGPMKGGVPKTHPTGKANTGAKGTLNFASGSTSPSSNNNNGNNGGDGDGDGDDDYNNNGGSTSSDPYSARLRKKNVHGVLNAVSWGTMMPLGAIIARYLKVFKSADPAWFYLHVTCQTTAYIVGVAGWATGLKLGDEGSETGYHGAIGAVLFIGGTLQVFALLLRPKKDHKYRFFWNIYHHSIGYTTIILSIVNVFKGLDILDPSKVWKQLYILILIVLGSLAVVLEAVTWFIVIRRRRSLNSDKYPPVIANGGANGNGYTNGRPHHGV